VDIASQTFCLVHFACQSKSVYVADARLTWAFFRSPLCKVKPLACYVLIAHLAPILSGVGEHLEMGDNTEQSWHGPKARSLRPKDRTGVGLLGRGRAPSQPASGSGRAL